MGGDSVKTKKARTVLSPFEIQFHMEGNHCVRTIHPEMNAIIQAAKHGIRIEGSDLYVTASPCWICFKMIANAGVRRIIFGEFYNDDRIFEAARELDIEMLLLPPTQKQKP